MIRYSLIPASYLGAPVVGDPFPTIGASKWALILSVSHLAAGGSVTVTLEQSPTGDEATWTTLHSFGEVSAVGVTTVRSYDVAEAAATVGLALNAATRYIRAKVTANTGDYALSVQAEAVVLDALAESDLALLSQDAREWRDGLTRTLSEAQEVVRSYLGGARHFLGRLEAHADDPDFLPVLRHAVAAQVEEIVARYRDVEGKRPVHPISPVAASLLNPFRTSAARGWRGR